MAGRDGEHGPGDERRADASHVRAELLDGGKKTAQLRMTFDDRAVTSVSMFPGKRPNPRTIPVTKEQLEGVLDPMSGAFLSAHSENPNGDLKVCNQTLPVFDGKQRFDLVITPKRAVNVQRATPGAMQAPR